MNAALVQREVALAGVALLAAVVALALTSYGSHANARELPQPVTVAGGGWRANLAGASLGRFGHRTNCGIVLRPGTIGVADSVLPCGVKLYVAFKDSSDFLVQVIARRPVTPGRKFDLTPKLAEELGIDGVQRIRWAFAGTALQ